MSSEILFHKREGIGTITFNRPDKLNALRIAEARSTLLKLVHDADKDQSVRVLILRGNGKAFCVGWDISKERRSTWDTVEGATSASEAAINFFYEVSRSRKPKIAMTHGYAVGAGLFLALSCDIVYSTEDCKFATIEVRHGGPAYEFWAPWNVPRNIALEMAFTGDFIDGKRAQNVGLVNRAFRSYEDLVKATTVLAKKICLLDPFGVQMNKFGIDSWYDIQRYSHMPRIAAGAMVTQMSAKDRYKWIELRRKYGFRGLVERRDRPFKNLDKRNPP
jgi:enoyl-CoA hydratase